MIAEGQDVEHHHRTSFPMHLIPEWGSLILVPASSLEARAAAASFTATCWWMEGKKKKEIK